MIDCRGINLVAVVLLATAVFKLHISTHIKFKRYSVKVYVFH